MTLNIVSTYVQCRGNQLVWSMHYTTIDPLNESQPTCTLLEFLVEWLSHWANACEYMVYYERNQDEDRGEGEF